MVPRSLEQIPGIFVFCSQYFRDLSRSDPSKLTSMQIDIAISTFQLTMAILHTEGFIIHKLPLHILKMQLIRLH